MNEERDKFITEAMGGCWHIYDENKPLMTYSLYAYVCEVCKGFILGNNNFSCCEDFTKLLTWVRDRQNLKGFVEKYDDTALMEPKENNTYRDKFLDDLYRYLEK